MAYLEKINDFLYAHTKAKTIGNVGVIVTDKGNFLIDTSMYPSVARELRTEIEKIKTGKIGAVFLTHYHADHTFGNQVFHDGPIYGHQAIVDNMKTNYNEKFIEKRREEATEEQKELYKELAVTLPNKVFHESPLMVDEDNTIKIYQVGGHTSGSSIIHYEEEHAVFAGDDLFAGRYPWGGDVSASPYDWITALDTIQELQPKVIIPGHGDVLYSLDEVANFKAYFIAIIGTSKKLAQDQVTEAQAVEELSTIDFYDPGKRVQMKEMTLKHFYKVVKEKTL